MRKDYRERLPALLVDGFYTKTYKADCGRRLLYKEYSIYSNMYNRVYSKARQTGDPCYEKALLSENFQDYDYFAAWCQSQKGFHNKGWVLDKDVLSGGVKYYSEYTCVFIPILINSFLTFSRKHGGKSGYAGVTWHEGYTKSHGKYIVSCAQLNGKNKTLGRTHCPLEGYKLYRKEKVRLAKVLAERYKGEVDDRVYDYLLNFDKYIDNMAIKETL